MNNGRIDTCWDCFFFQRPRSAKAEKGWCRRYAPKPRAEPAVEDEDCSVPKYEVEWPSVYTGEWCGEFRTDEQANQ